MNGQINNNQQPQILNNDVNQTPMNNQIPTSQNIVPQMPNMNPVLPGTNNDQNIHAFTSTTITQNNQPNIENNNIPVANQIPQNNSNTFINDLQAEGINIHQDQNKFLNNNTFNEMTINNLNVDGTYNNISKPDYTNDPKVIENMNKMKKNTIKITNELKVFILISIILLIFIIVMPYISSFIRNIKYQ